MPEEYDNNLSCAQWILFIRIQYKTYIQIPIMTAIFSSLNGQCVKIYWCLKVSDWNFPKRGIVYENPQRVRTWKSMVTVFSCLLEYQWPLECQIVFALLSNIFDKGLPSHTPPVLEIVASSLSPYQILSSGEHDSVSTKGSSTETPFSHDGHSRVRDRDPFLAWKICIKIYFFFRILGEILTF